ncbi:flagellar L-ring protein precursor FlgH [Pectinatus cerevisiiphilus]|uniref:Flagellar L-ring protein FlgH n=2 Tax=Pectinatus cerevisiiphilus TaxID=86956 RepID=A0A4R3KC79_9FIRM|nr:flagellar L-ring protein precursor FlgH [Pectinatus cerevisiiphilus]
MKMKHAIYIMLFLFGAVVFPHSLASAQSLWADSQNNYSMSLFADRKAHNIGDILTVIISESSSTSATKSMSNGKTANNSLNAGAGIFSFLAQASAGQSDSFKADGSAKDTNTVNGKITVTVVDVQPNGNMVVEGTQSIWQNKDEHKITLRGTVRQDDVAYDNTVPSYLVADATLKFDGKGPLNAKQRQGILSQIFNVLF